MNSIEADIYDPYADPRLLRAVSVGVAGPGRLRVVFDDGAERVVDLSARMSASRWLRTLSEPATFETVEIINGGRAIQWITGADYCVDALRILADQQLAEQQGGPSAPAALPD